ncbi:MAG: (d)CMP kinase [Anaerolineales bacterium]|nr:(d)CMP kinase [Anaerolineales bacterium]
MAPPDKIAIDGPAASGKSTLAALLADRIGYLYLDTGVMYRAVTLATLLRSVAVDDEQAVTAIATTAEIDVRPPSKDDGRQYDVLLDGHDVTWGIRTPEVDADVSQVSMYSGVRQAMTLRQREIGLRGRVVMVGRDIGTVVLPEADLKIYLDASVEARAERRFLESQQRGELLTYEEILAAMKARDRLDSTRDLAPLVAAADAIIIDSTSMGIDELFEFVYALVMQESKE